MTEHVRSEDVQSTDRVQVGDRMRVSAMLMREWLVANPQGDSALVVVKEIVTEDDGTKKLIVSHAE